MDKPNVVASFFYYMWNAWCEEECMAAFVNSTCPWSHFWGKWCGICDKHGVWGAAEMFYAELSDENREFLVNRACQVYNGKRRVKVNSENNE